MSNPQLGEFGFRSRTLFVAGLLVAVGLYAFGWALENPRYWLADRAIAVWAVALPLWLGLVAFAWRAPRRGWPVGAWIAVPMFVIHVGIMAAARRWRVNDDTVGIAAMFSGAALGGWLLGRFAHLRLRIRRARSSTSSS